MFLFSIFFLITQSQHKMSIYLKSKISSEIRFFLKDSMNIYLNIFGLNFKKKQKRIVNSSNGKKIDIEEFKNNFLDYQGPRAYFSKYNNELVLVSGTGLITYTNISSLFSKQKN